MGRSSDEYAASGVVSANIADHWLRTPGIARATAACLGAGAPGGLFTPTLTIGVLLASVLTGLWSHIWPHTVGPSYALIGGGAFLAAAMQGPIAAVVLVLELTRHLDLLMAPTLLAVTEATIVARKIGAPSIYSARLSPEPFAGGGHTEEAVIEALGGDYETLPADADDVALDNEKRRPDPGAGPGSKPALKSDRRA